MTLLVLRFDATLTQNNQYHSGLLGTLWLVMKISLQEIQNLEKFIQDIDDGVFDEEHDDFNSWEYFSEHPQFLMAMGFDEYLAFENKSQFQSMWFSDAVEDCKQSMYREPSGRWHILFGAPYGKNYSEFMFHSRNTLWDENKEDEGSLVLKLSDVFEQLYSLADRVTEDDHIIWSPRLWTPSSQESERRILSDKTSQILTSLKSEAKTFEDLSWQQFEDVVAECIRSMGLKIHKIVESPQGGRDIIARGELIPGEEPITIAVEVKHKKVVDRPDLEKALWQNRRFPALMFVTSGRFTAGVLKEKSLPENRLRLFLKDGDALGDVIRGFRF